MGRPAKRPFCDRDQRRELVKPGTMSVCEDMWVEEAAKSLAAFFSGVVLELTDLSDF